MAKLKLDFVDLVQCLRNSTITGDFLGKTERNGSVRETLEQ